MSKANNAGRKAAGAMDNAGYQTLRRVTLDDSTVDILKRYGAGNLSAGVRKAAALIDSIETAYTAKNQTAKG